MAREVIEFGCVSGLEFGCEAVAACLTVAAAVVEDIGDKLSRRGLFLRPTGAESLPGGVVAARFTFTHALYRDALYRRIPAARRARAHHKLGLWIAAQGGRPGEVAYHLLAAGDRVAAVRFRLEAAEQANVVCAFDEAAAHFAAAQQLLAEQPATESTRVDILVRLGQAQQRGGAIARAQQTLIEAIDLARQFQLAPALAQATLLIGHGYQRLGRNDVPLQAWLDEALTLLADADPLLRARLLAHLQFVLCEVVGTDARRQHLGDEALAIARRSGDPDTLLWVLHYTRWSNHGPFDAQARLAGVAELAGLRGMVHGAEAGLTIEVLLVADLLELGDIAAAKAALGRLDAALQDAPIPWCVWFAERLRSMCALHVGDLDAAERALHEGWRVGQHMDNPNVLAVYVAQQVILAMLRGTPEIVEPIVRQAVAAAPQIVAWRCVLSYLCAELGSLDEAGQLFEEVMGNGLTDLPQDSVWLVALTFLSLSAARLGLSSAAPRILELLHPQAERCSGISAGLFSMGSVRRYLALLSQTGGTRKGTRRAMQEAVAANRQLGASPWLAQTLVEAAASASNPAERKQAMAYLDEADSIATRLGLRGLADRIAQLRSA